MKKTILLEILELTKEQQIAIEVSDIGTFGVLLDKRQIQMNRLDELHRLHPEYKEDNQRELLQQILDLDEVNARTYKEQFKEVRRKLNELRSRKRVNTIYTNPYTIANEEGIFFDKGR